MRPVRHNLRAIREKPDTDDKEKLSEYGRALIVNIKTVGEHIEQQIRNLSSPAREKKLKHLWYTAFLNWLTEGVLYATSGLQPSRTGDFKECMRVWLLERRRKLLPRQQQQWPRLDSEL